LHFSPAFNGFTPFAAKKNLFNYVIYFSCIFSITFDDITSNPIPISLDFISRRLRTILRDFVIVSAIISILKEYGYESFNTTLPPDSMEHSLAELFSWQHLVNNFLVAGEIYE
jgi:hypothetical protein